MEQDIATLFDDMGSFYDDGDDDETSKKVIEKFSLQTN